MHLLRVSPINMLFKRCQIPFEGLFENLKVWDLESPKYELHLICQIYLFIIFLSLYETHIIEKKLLYFCIFQAPLNKIIQNKRRHVSFPYFKFGVSILHAKCHMAWLLETMVSILAVRMATWQSTVMLYVLLCDNFSFVNSKKCKKASSCATTWPKVNTEFFKILYFLISLFFFYCLLK